MAGTAGIKSGPGRPAKLTKAVAERIIRAVGLGHTYAEAARCGGVVLDTMQRWRKRGREDLDAGIESKYADFCSRVESIQDETAERYLESIERSATEPVVIKKVVKKKLPDGTKHEEMSIETRPADIKGAMWWLERRRPDTFGRRTQLEHSGEIAGDGGAHKLILEIVDPPKLDADGWPLEDGPEDAAD